MGVAGIQSGMTEPIYSEGGMTSTLRGNIALLEERRRAEAARAGWGTRVALRITCFTGSMTFVLIHAVAYGLWLLVNAGLVPGLPRFDPTFVGLATEASVEAIFLSTFVLISQNRMAEQAERRADLDLHINLLAEHELTRLAALVERIAERLEVPVDDPDFAEVKRDVAPEQVLDTLDRVRASGE
jgi:uncharacterized membrane protein